MPDFSPAQRRYIRKHSKYHEPDASEEVGELNIIPFLDIVVNLIMFLLMTTATVAFYAEVEAQLPEYKRGIGSRASRSAEEKLNLSVTVATNGIIVAASGGKLAPGCEDTAPGRVMTVPKTAQGEYDFEALTNCVAKVKSEFQNEDQVIVSADALVEYQYLIQTMDAVRSKGEDELFPNVLLSGGLR